MDAIFSQLAEPTPAYTQQQMAQLSSIRAEYEQRDAAIADLIADVTEVQEVRACHTLSKLPCVPRAPCHPIRIPQS